MSEDFIYLAVTRLIIRLFGLFLTGGITVFEGASPRHDSSLKEDPRDRRQRQREQK
jgi:hypothetical protein